MMKGKVARWREYVFPASRLLNVPRRLTGDRAIDQLLGGLRIGDVTAFTKDGSFTLGMMVAASLSKQGDVLWVDPDSAFDAASFAAMGGELGHIWWLRTKGMYDVLWAMQLLVTSKDFVLVVVDLLSGPGPVRVVLSGLFKVAKRGMVPVLLLSKDSPLSNSVEATFDGQTMIVRKGEAAIRFEGLRRAVYYEVSPDSLWDLL